MKPLLAAHWVEASLACVAQGRRGGLGGHWVPNDSRSRPRAPGTLSCLNSPPPLLPRRPPAYPTYSTQPGLSGLYVGGFESRAQILHVLSGQLGTVAALRPWGWGVGSRASLQAVSLSCPPQGHSASFGQSSPQAWGVCGQILHSGPNWALQEN